MEREPNLDMSTKELDQKIRELKPRFKEISPIVAWHMKIFGLLNLFNGWYLYFVGGEVTKKIPLADDLIPLEYHGIAFFVLGVAMLVAYRLNSWSTMRRLLLVGLTLKAIWLVGLVMIVLQGSNPLLLGWWTFITSVQIIDYVYFYPRAKRKTDE